MKHSIQALDNLWEYPVEIMAFTRDAFIPYSSTQQRPYKEWECSVLCVYGATSTLFWDLQLPPNNNHCPKEVVSTDRSCHCFQKNLMSLALARRHTPGT